MKIIVDSGSTKAEWIFADNKEVSESIITEGLNPFFTRREKIKEVIESIVGKQQLAVGAVEIYFYGSGCAAKDKKELVKNIFSEVFSAAVVHVHTDIEGSAKAILGNQRGIACILGTGSNSCLYDGDKVEGNIPSNGYIFGDEGSGSDIGKRFIGKYLNNDLSVGLKAVFEDRFQLKRADILDNVYRRAYPNRFLASFVPFVKEYSSDESIKDIILSSFDTFIKTYISKYPLYNKLPIGFTGSVAYYLREELEMAMNLNELMIYKIVKSPIVGLGEFHNR